jgi:hypothetical protein
VSSRQTDARGVEWSTHPVGRKNDGLQFVVDDGDYVLQWRVDGWYVVRVEDRRALADKENPVVSGPHTLEEARGVYLLMTALEGKSESRYTRGRVDSK